MVAFDDVTAAAWRAPPSPDRLPGSQVHWRCSSRSSPCCRTGSGPLGCGSECEWVRWARAPPIPARHTTRTTTMADEPHDTKTPVLIAQVVVVDPHAAPVQY